MRKFVFALLLVLFPYSLLAGPQNPTGMAWLPLSTSVPPNVTLNPSVMQDLDGRNLPEALGLRRRPWLNGPESPNLVIENLRVHHIINGKGVMVSMGSTDKRTPDGKIASYANGTFRNLDIFEVVRDQVGDQQGIHGDLFWVTSDADPSIKPNLLFENIWLHDANGGIMPLLMEAGCNWGNITFRNIAVTNVAHPLTIKCQNSSFQSFVIDNCPNTVWSFQGTGQAFTVLVQNSAGIKIDTSSAPQVTVTYASDDLAMLKKQLADLNNQLNTLKTQQGATQQQLTDTQTKLTDTQSKLTAAQAQIEVLKNRTYKVVPE